MHAALRWVSGFCALGLLAATAWLAQAEPSSREIAGFRVPLKFAALWTAQISFLAFAASRWFRARARGLPPRAWESAVLKAARPAALSALLTPAAWALWSAFVDRSSGAP